MKKKLFTLLISAFACVGANADSWTVKFSADFKVATITCTEQNGVDNEGSFTYLNANNESLTNSDGKSKLQAAETLNFYTNSGVQISSLGAFQSLKPFAATTVDFSKATFKEDYKGLASYTDINGVQQTVEKYQNCMRFTDFANVTTAILANVKTLNEDTFQARNNVTTFTIPTSVTCIETNAVTATPIVSITIPKEVKYIEGQAFMNDKIESLIDVFVEGETAAAKNAFDFKVTVGQTDANYQKYATLHFPEGKEDFFTNTGHTLSQATSLDKGAFQEWLKDHKDFVGANGWQQFINSASGTPEKAPANKVVLRTFSDNVARLVPLNFRAYIVTGLKPVDQGYEVILAQIFAIPANTGVILYGEVDKNSTGYSLGRIPSWDDTEENKQGDNPTFVAPYRRGSATVGGVSTTNYMVPTVTQTTLYPTYKSTSIWSAAWPLSGDMKQYTTGTEVTDRNFILADFCDTSLKEAKNVTADSNDNFVGFFRVKANVKCGPNKAYLSLPAGLYDSAEGAEAIVVKPSSPESMIFRTNEWNQPTNTGNWGQRGGYGPLHAKFAGFEEEVTGISNVNTESVSDNSYYTLEGVKVAHPQKGVYVKNGKKIIK